MTENFYDTDIMISILFLTSAYITALSIISYTTITKWLFKCQPFHKGDIDMNMETPFLVLERWGFFRLTEAYFLEYNCEKNRSMFSLR